MQGYVYAIGDDYDSPEEMTFLCGDCADALGYDVDIWPLAPQGTDCEACESVPGRDVQACGCPLDYRCGCEPDPGPCAHASTRWLTDEDGTWEPGEKPIRVCTDCGEETER